MGNISRVVATAFIWVAMVGIMVTIIESPRIGDEWVIPVMGLLAIGGGVVGTGVVWSSGNSLSPREAVEKTKRRSRIEQFLDTVDERELEELRGRLISEEDGELVSLEEVLKERRKPR